DRASSSRSAPSVSTSPGTRGPRLRTPSSSSRSVPRSNPGLDMSDDQDPKPTTSEEPEHLGLGERVGEAVERVEEKVEHAVEEVAEGVAEHVPEPIRAPVRWTVRKLLLVGGLSLVAVVLIAIGATAYYVWNHTEWASHELTWRVNQVLREH